MNSFKKQTEMQSVIVLKGFIKQIKLLMVTMEITFSEWNFAELLWLIDVFESILTRNIAYLVKLP